VNWQDKKKYDKVIETENTPTIEPDQKSLSDYL
jgi:hypothetical protein